MRVGASDLSASAPVVKAVFPDVDRAAFDSVPQPDFSKFCRLFLEQITTCSPGICTWLKYYSPDTHYPQFFSNHSPDWVGFTPKLLPYLESEDWWIESLPVFELQALPIGGDRWVYVCALSHTNRAEYLLIAAMEPFTNTQKCWLATQVGLLQQHFCLFQAWHQQQSTMHYLKQIIQRTQHQIRNPLALIEIYTLMLNTALPEGELRSHASHIQNAAKELSAHFQHLGKSHSSTALQLKHHDLHWVLAESLKGLQPWLTQKQITIQQPAAPAGLPIDAWQLKQVFDNLLTNAIYFSPTGSTITCHWQVFCHEVLVDVWDEGPGLSDADLQQIFTPFYSRRPGGTGLGLAIAQKIVLDHHGRLWVKNLPGQGAKFSFTLPRQQPARPATACSLTPV